MSLSIPPDSETAGADHVESPRPAPLTPGPSGTHRWLTRSAERLRVLITGGFYGTIALNATINFLAVILGFGIASAWQARLDERREIGNELGAVTFLADEVAGLSLRAGDALGQNCKVNRSDFTTPRWNVLNASGRAIDLEQLYDEINRTYAYMEAKLEAASVGNPQSCDRHMTELRGRLESLRNTMINRKGALEARRQTLLSTRVSSGLLTLIGVAMAGMLVVLGSLPALYGLMLAAMRVIR